MFYSRLLPNCIFATFALLSKSVAAGPLANVGYATYEGTSLSNGVNQFLGMRYAAPPIGDRRFRRPLEPLPEVEVVQASQVRTQSRPC